MFAVENGLQGDPRLKAISDAIRVIPHFPKTGIMFQDITTLLLDPVAFKHVVDIFVDRYKHMNISLVAGVEARGFIFGSPIALAIGAKFIPLRKPGKLPGKVISEEYELEYGRDRLEMSVEAVKSDERALVIDDLVATGGTLSASISLLERAGAEVVECACVVGLPKFKGQCKLKGKPLYVLFLFWANAVSTSSTLNSLIGKQVVRVSPFQAEGLRPVMVSRTMGGFTINIIDTHGLVEAGYVNHQDLDLIKGSESGITVVYAENSGRCSKNDKDEKALPNGVAWIPNLVKAITD
ncbi:unnamed protein product [Arabidopsis arenosa]|uniref:adenine phosphoribosyltransferase n=1 Tax=Arabidopsis arenosa TaxID=38785 RepID=A0A8S1ZXN9_ARAAE|nr:unnamed protein product [Arabidopsis arenosa]